MRHYIRKTAVLSFLAACMVFVLPPPAVRAAARLQDTGEKIVIVIDPGHGGENLGTTENGHEEKHMTMVTAEAMYDELALYDNVEVYLTRTGDRELSLKERAEFAASVDADFLFSIHYNASETHESFGAEAWVPLSAPYNAYGYQFGCEFLKNMREMGLLVRGVKTRAGSKGDYYGIIRESAALGVPAMILEHCHVDEDRDEVFCSDDEKLAAFGRADGTAAARYFGLKSRVLNVDYSGYELADADENALVPYTRQDQTGPETCLIEFVRADYDEGVLTLSVSAVDHESAVLYYSYSLDGGNTFSHREAWPESDALNGSYQESFFLDIDIPAGTTPQVVVRAYNIYDFYSDSNIYISTQSFSRKASVEVSAVGAGGTGQPSSGRPDDRFAGNEGNENALHGTGLPENNFSGDGANQALHHGETTGNASGDALIIPVDAPIEDAPVKSQFSLVNLIWICLIAVVLLAMMIFVFQSIVDRRHRRRRH